MRNLFDEYAMMMLEVVMASAILKCVGEMCKKIMSI